MSFYKQKQKELVTIGRKFLNYVFVKNKKWFINFFSLKIKTKLIKMIKCELEKIL